MANNSDRANLGVSQETAKSFHIETIGYDVTRRRYRRRVTRDNFAQAKRKNKKKLGEPTCKACTIDSVGRDRISLDISSNYFLKVSHNMF